MARPGKEQTFFIASIAITGLLAALLLMEDFKVASVPAGAAFDRSQLDLRSVPGAPRGALKDSGFARGGREAFREPRDWQPLPPADLERPPLRDPAYVPPPAPLRAGIMRLSVYRQQHEVTPHEFEVAGAADGAAAEGAATPANGPASAPTNAPAGATPGAASAAPRTAAGSAGAGATSALPPTRDEEFQLKYDWIDLASDPRPWYVIIKNADKYRLIEDPALPIEFVRINPDTGRVMIGGTLPRERLKPDGIHFARTPINRAEGRLREIPESQWGIATLPRLLDAAADAIALGGADPACCRAALARLEKWLQIESSNARTYELMADARATLLDFEGELLVLQRAEKAGIDAAGIHRRHARWLRRAGASTGALERLSIAANRFPADREVRLDYGRALLDAGAPEQVEQAIQQFALAEQASDTTAERIEVMAEAGAALLERGDPSRALDEAKRILKIDAKAVAGLRLEGAAELALQRFSDAEGEFTRMADAAGSVRESAEALLSLGIARTRLRAFDLAAGDLRRARELDPLLLQMAATAESELEAVTGHLDKAVTRARDAVAAGPADPYVRYFLGRLLRQSGDLEGGRAELLEALRLGAGFSDLFNELGYVSLLQGRVSDAQRYFEESLAREERDEGRLLLAHACLAAGDLVRARQLFEQLQSRRTTSEALLGLAFCAYRGGESAEAQQAWLQVKDELKDAPADDRAYAARWLAMVQDLESKQVWEDTLQWSAVGNGWSDDARHGPTVTSRPPGNVCLSGTQKPTADAAHLTLLQRDVDLALFHDYEVECAFQPAHRGRMGMGLIHWQPGSANQAPRIRAALTVALDVDGTVWLQRCEHVGDEAFEKIGTHMVKAGDSVTLGLRRIGRGEEKFQFLLDGAPLTEVIEMAPWKGKSRTSLTAAFFGSAAAGKECDVRLEAARRTEFLP
jgi:tetratricopeptide (TPR) repeat protein